MVPSSRPVKWGPAGIALGYCAIAIFWIGFSDLAVTHLGLSPVLLTVKGFVFVAVTAYLLYITVRRLVGTVQQASRERDETARLYQTVVEASQEGICLLNEAGEISFLNTHLAAMLGRPAEELHGKPLQDFLHGSDSLPHDTNRNSQSQTHECRLRTGAAGDVWVLISFTPLLDATGAHCGSLAVLVDVTQRKRLEEELRGDRPEVVVLMNVLRAIV
ncbi:MAG TPA: PAS domain-containing protein [Terriglobales bacterium]|nr:PAS domain-containing protein [Terriglobales bacterium]